MSLIVAHLICDVPFESGLRARQCLTKGMILVSSYFNFYPTMHRSDSVSEILAMSIGLSGAAY